MNAAQDHVRMEVFVPMASTAIDVVAPLDLQERTVKLTLMTVPACPTLVLMEELVETPLLLLYVTAYLHTLDPVVKLNEMYALTIPVSMADAVSIFLMTVFTDTNAIVHLEHGAIGARKTSTNATTIHV